MLIVDRRVPPKPEHGPAHSRLTDVVARILDSVREVGQELPHNPLPVLGRVTQKRNAGGSCSEFQPPARLLQ